jgi:hypothetical protein
VYVYLQRTKYKWVGVATKKIGEFVFITVIVPVKVYSHFFFSVVIVQLTALVAVRPAVAAPAVAAPKGNFARALPHLPSRNLWYIYYVYFCLPIFFI